VIDWEEHLQNDLFVLSGT